MENRGKFERSPETRSKMSIHQKGSIVVIKEGIEKRIFEPELISYIEEGWVRGNKQRHSTDDFIKKAKDKHGDQYDYSKVDYCGSHTPVTITCPMHGDFVMKPCTHINPGRGCRMCGIEKSRMANLGVKKITDWSMRTETFKNKFDASGPKYQIKNIDKYVCSIEPLTFVCPEHGDFDILPVNVLRGFGCRTCSTFRSSVEEVVSLWLTNFEVIHNQKILAGRELDLYLPIEQVGIEVNGLYWHSATHKNINYHKTKTEIAEKMGIHLFQFTDEEINSKGNIVRSMILNSLGKSKRVWARKTVLKEVSAPEARVFLEDNHIQGAGPVGSIRYGLYDGTELLALMTFGKSRYNKDFDFELYRFCNRIETSVVGAASKLLKHFRSEHKGSIISYANRRWSQGRLYEKLGFTKTHETQPNYVYTNGTKTISRQVAQKHKLPKLLGEKFDPTLSEEQNMHASGWMRIYDCGNHVFCLQ